jgi:hypothetical protein
MIVASPCGEFTLAKNQVSQLRRLAMLGYPNRFERASTKDHIEFSTRM